MLSTLLDQFLKSPAEWTASILLLATFIFQFMQRNLKRLKLEIARGDVVDARGTSVKLTVINSGTMPVQIMAYGYKDWDGKLHEYSGKSVVINQLLQPEQIEEWYFHDHGNFLDIRDSDVYYFFVRTATKTIRMYPTFFVIAWMKYWLKKIV